MSANPGWDRQPEPPGRRGGQVNSAPVTAADLSQWDETWQKAEVKDNAGGTYENKPDGKYIGQIAAAAMERTRKDGTPMCVLRFEIQGGPASGEYVHRRALTSSDQVRFLKQDLHNIGLDITALSQLPEALPQWIGVCVEFVLKSKPGNDGQVHQNCYLNRWIDPDEVEAAIAEVGAAGAAADNSPVPF